MSRFAQLLSFSAMALLGVPAMAATIDCAGDYGSYHFTVHAQSRKGQVVSKIHVEINQGTTYRADLTPTSSAIVTGKSLKFAGQGSDGQGSIDATFAGGNQYHGRLNAETGFGNVTVNVICLMNGVALPY